MSRIPALVLALAAGCGPAEAPFPARPAVRAPPPPVLPPVLRAPAWTFDGAHRAAELGEVVEGIGDVNGDGFADVAVSAPPMDLGKKGEEGHVYVFHGSASGLAAAADWTASGPLDEAYFGTQLAGAGDVNGDGFDDVLVTDIDYPLFYGGYVIGDNDTHVYLYLGSPTGLAATPAWTSGGFQIGESLGFTTRGAGDVNGDGFADFVLGAPLYEGGQLDEGRISVWFGSAAGPAATPDWSWESDVAGEAVGIASGAGDVDADGYDDLLIGRPEWDDPFHAVGRVQLHRGGPAGPEAAPSWTAEGPQHGAAFSGTVAPAGDVNGDGFADVILGARSHDTGKTDAGRAYVFHGSATGLSATADWIASGGQLGELFGWSVDGAGDVDGDGFDDVVVGGPGYDDPEEEEGGAWVFLGSPGGLGATAAWGGVTDQDLAQVGASVAGAGDVNGDGYADVVAGAPGYGTPFATAGRAYVWHGSCDLPDADADGFSCGDCDDDDATVHPGAPEVVDDGIDQDCDRLDADGGTVGPGDSGDPPDTDLPDDTDAPDTDLPDDTDAPVVGEADDDGKGGCSSAGPTPPWLAILALLGLRRRRQRPRRGGCTPSGARPARHLHLPAPRGAQAFPCPDLPRAPPSS